MSLVRCPDRRIYANSIPTGHTGALGYLGNPNDEVANKKRSEGIAVLVEDLKPGLAWTLDFSENMGEIIKINGELSLVL